MNQTFDPSRFLRLLRAHWAESWKTYAWFVGVSAVVNGIFLAMALRADSTHQYFGLQQSAQSSWYTYGLVATGLVFATRYFESFSGAGSTLIQLMRPASAFEKWCLALLFVGVLFPLVYTLVYVCMNTPAVAYAKAHYVVPTYLATAQVVQPQFQTYLPFTTMSSNAGATSFDLNAFTGELLFAFQFLGGLALCLGGRVFFKRAAVLKTWLLVFSLLLVGVCLGMFGVMVPLIPGMYWTVEAFSGSVFDAWAAVLLCAVLFGVPILLWIGLLFHIKEREVA
jgi:hypothetical protein